MNTENRKNFRIKNQIIKSLLFMFVLAGYFLLVQDAKGAVHLSRFETSGEDQQVRIVWSTDTELNTAGFYIQRSDSENGNYIRVSSFIFHQGDSITGADYEYIDSGLINGQVYWYRLEEIETNQNSIYYDPESAMPWDPSIPTPSGTATNTPTTTSTLTNQSGNPTPTSTRTPTKTVSASAKTSKPSKTPVPPTATRSYIIIGQATNPPANSNPTATTIPTENVQAVDTSQSQAELNTATLEPLPSLALVFATTPEQSTQVTNTPITLADPSVQKPSWISKKGLIIVGLLVVIWLALGGWFFFSFRRME
jgi:hypothetical protein